MKKVFLSFIILILLFYLTGCTNNKNNNTTISSSKKPTAEEILTQDINADIFQLDNIVYQTNIDWVNKLELTKKNQISETTAIFSKDFKKTPFHNGMATKLPKGTKIYSVNERKDILIIELNGKTKKYLAIFEG